MRRPLTVGSRRALLHAEFAPARAISRGGDGRARTVERTAVARRSPFLSSVTTGFFLTAGKP